jgi:hypothetical protein
MRMLVGMRVSVWMLMLMVLYLVSVLVPVAGIIVGMLVCGFDDDVDLGSREASASDFVHFELRADVQGRGGFFKQGEGYAGIHQSAEQHVSANAGKAVEVGNSHREKL